MIPWTVACQAPLSVQFSKQEYWSGLPFPTPGDLPHPGIELMFLVSPALACNFFFLPLVPPGKPESRSGCTQFTELPVAEVLGVLFRTHPQQCGQCGLWWPHPATAAAVGIFAGAIYQWWE